MSIYDLVLLDRNTNEKLRFQSVDHMINHAMIALTDKLQTFYFLKSQEGYKRPGLRHYALIGVVNQMGFHFVKDAPSSLVQAAKVRTINVHTNYTEIYGKHSYKGSYLSPIRKDGNHE